MVEISKPKPPITTAQITAVEAALKVLLPADYKELMLKVNGGLVDPSSFVCIDGEQGDIAWFYHICPGDDNDILKRAKIRESRLPRGFVAIGYDGGGNEICIDCTPGPRYGKVYFWDHEMEADLSQGIGPDEAGNIHLIANSFTEFLDCLYEKNMDHIEPTGELVPDPEARKALEDLMRRKGLL